LNSLASLLYQDIIITKENEAYVYILM